MRVEHGDCLDVMRRLADEGVQVDAVVTDPPYGLEFMGKDWDAPWKAGVGGASSAGFNEKRYKDGSTARLPSFVGGTNPTCRNCGGLRSGRDTKKGQPPCRCGSPKFDNVYLPRMQAFGAWSKDWAELAFRLLKPGGHLVAFGGTRTAHRMVCAIEDAGFEIRDSIGYTSGSGPLAWVYGSGFPKSLNVSRALDEYRCMCPLRHEHAEATAFASPAVLQQEVHGAGEEATADAEDLRSVRQAVGAEDAVPSGAEQDVLAGVHGRHGRSEAPGEDQRRARAVRHLREADTSPAIKAEEIGGDLLQRDLSEQDIRGSLPSDLGDGIGCDYPGGPAAGGRSSEGCDEPRVEGRGDVPQEARELCERPLHPVPDASAPDGEDRRVHHGAPASDGRVGWAPADPNGVRSPSGPQPAEQRPRKSRTLAVQSQPQASGAWPVCGGCGKPRIPDGLGTSLKPAWEPICLARRPLAEPTVAAQVLATGTGALNIGATRIGTKTRTNSSAPRAERNGFVKGFVGGTDTVEHNHGRWPANVAHDGSPEVLEAFERFGESKSTAGLRGLQGRHDPAQGVEHNRIKPYSNSVRGHSDEGTAARFFYSAKASRADRAGSKHPTVKPVALMRWLCRMVCPPGGVILDPFAGSGTTGQAAREEGFDAILIEREAEYVEDIRRRLGRDLFAGAA